MDDPHPPLGPRFLRRLDAIRARLFRAAPGFRGSRSSNLVGGRGEFRENRAYVPGDDLSRVNWHAAARTDRLVVREHAREAEDAITVVLDATASMLAPDQKWDRAREIAAAMGVLALKSDGCARLVVFGPIRFEPREFRGAGRLHPFLDALRNLAPEGDGHAGPVLAQLLEKPGPRGPVAVISDFTCEPRDLSPLAALTARGREVLLVHMISAEERAPATAGNAVLRDSETGETMSLRCDADAMRRYAVLLEKHVKALRSLCLLHGARCVVVDPECSIEDVLLRHLTTDQ